MTSTLPTRGDTREATVESQVSDVNPLVVCAQRVWIAFSWAAKLVFVWLVMVGLPLVYEKRLVCHSWDSGERLALQQPARTSGTGAPASHLLNEPELHISKMFIKRCVLEWRVFATTLNVVILRSGDSLPYCSVLNLVTRTFSLTIALLSILNGQLLTRTLLYSTFACALSAFVIGSVYSVHLEHIQDTQECSRWLSRVCCSSSIHVMPLTTVPAQASRHDLLIKFHIFLALPLTWSIWGLLLFTASLVSYIWTYSGELTTPSAGGGNIDSVILETWRFWWGTLPTALLMVGVWNFWLLWMVFGQLSKSETDAPTVQAPVYGTEGEGLEHPEPYVL